MRVLLLFLLRLCALGIAALTFLPLLWRVEPRLIALEAMAPQFGIAAIGLGMALLLLRSWVWTGVGFVTAIWSLVLVWPDLVSPMLSDRTEAKTEVDAAALKIVSFNVWFDNPDTETTLAYLSGSGADVIGLVEVTPEIKVALAPLDRIYPYRIDCLGADPECEIMLLSKHPLLQPYAGPLDGRFPYVAEGEIEWGGQIIGIAMTHLSWPFLPAPRPPLAATELPPPVPELPNLPRLEQSVQAANLAQHVATLPADLVLMGDFNSPPWGAMQAALRSATGLDNRGRLLFTWPAWAQPMFRLPIDQVFTRGRLRVIGIAAGPQAGSDHLPIEAEIGLVR